MDLEEDITWCVCVVAERRESPSKYVVLKGFTWFIFIG